MITREEYELLKEYRRLGYKWIARDKNGRLFVYQEIPRRYRKTWNFGGVVVNIRGEYFTYIKWEDEEPTKIEDLINDYESHKEIVGEKVKVQIPQFVADWIRKIKGTYTLKLLFTNSNMPSSVEDWLYCNNENCELMALAWIYGYEVEKEQLYTVRLKNGYHLCKYEGTGVRWLNMTEFNTADCYKLTQSEIESVDPRLMQFAEVVE